MIERGDNLPGAAPDTVKLTLTATVADLLVLAEAYGAYAIHLDVETMTARYWRKPPADPPRHTVKVGQLPLVVSAARRGV